MGGYDPYASLGFKGKRAKKRSDRAAKKISRRQEAERQIRSGKRMSPGAESYARKEYAEGRPVVKSGPRRTREQLAKKRQQNLAQVILGQRRLVKPIATGKKPKYGPYQTTKYPGGKTTEYDRVAETIRRLSAEDRRRRTAPVKALGLDLPGGRGLLNAVGDTYKMTVGPLNRKGGGPTTAVDAVTKVLEQYSRPYYGVTGTADALVKGKNVKQAASEGVKGLALKNRKETWDVLESAGVKDKRVKYGLGIPLAFAADPTSYASAGAAPATGGASLAANAPKVQRILSLLGRAQKAQQGVKAATKADKVLGKTGLRLRVGARVPLSQKHVGFTTSGRTTARIGEHIPERVKNAGLVRGAQKTFNHSARRTGLTRTETDVARDAERAFRSKQHIAAGTRKGTESGLRHAIDKEAGINGLQRRLRPRKSREKYDAAAERISRRLEETPTGPLGKIETHIKEQMDELRRLENEAGIQTPELTKDGGVFNYLPRYKRRQIEKGAHKAAIKQAELAGTQGKARARMRGTADYAKRRVLRRPMSQIDDTGSPEDLSRVTEGVVARRKADSILDRGRGDYYKTLKSFGTRVDKDEVPTALNVDQAIYKFDPEAPHLGLTEVKPKDVGGKGEFYVINRNVVEESKRRIADVESAGTHGFAKGWDKATGRWKGVVTVASPSYYLRNLIGDTVLGYQGGTDAKSFVDSMRVSRASRKREKIIRKGKDITKGADPDAPLKKLELNINGKKVSALELEEGFLKSGAIGGGTIGGEVAQLVGSNSFSANNPLARLNIRRENMPRRATAIAAMKRGDDFTEASRYANKHHFDYGDLTAAEQTAFRRAIPFYTFWARNTRKQLETLVLNPGKSMGPWHVMNGMASAAGFEDYRDYVSNLSESQQRGLPVPIKVKGEIKTLQFGNILADLQTFSPSPDDFLDNLFGRLHPIKSIPEIKSNYSAFYRDQIAPEYSKNTAAPGFLRSLPPEIRNALKLTEGLDKKTGQSRLEWNKKIDYALRNLGPQASFVLSMLTGGRSGPFEQSRTDALIGLSGVKPTTYYPDQAEIGKLYDKYGELRDKQTDFSGRTDVPQARKNAVNAQIKAVSKKIHDLEKNAGYAVPFGEGGGKPKSTNPLDVLDRALKGDSPDPLEQLNKALKTSSAPTSTTKPVVAKTKATKSQVAKTERRLTRAGKRDAAPKLVAAKPSQTRSAPVVAVASTNTGSPKTKPAKALTARVTSGGSSKGLEDVASAAAKYGPELDGVAKQYGINGEELILKTIKGESGGRKNAVSSVGARGWAQFMPGSRQEAIRKIGADPWRSPEEAVQALVLHMKGGINGKKGLEGYNPGGGQAYVSYILGQRVGSGGGKVDDSDAAAEVIASPQTKIPKAAIAAYLRNPKKKGALLELAMAAKESRSTPAQTPRTSTRSAGGGSDPWKAALAAGAKVSDGIRPPGTLTSSGNISDHTGRPGSGTMARDFTGNLPKIANEIARSLGIKGYRPGRIYNINKGGYRYQLIYGTGDHLDHVHLGRRPA